MTDIELCKRLRDKHADDSLAWHAAERIKELKRELNRAERHYTAELEEFPDA